MFKRWLTLLTLAVILAGVSGMPIYGAASATSLVSPDGWERQSPLYSWLGDISGTSASDVFAVGGSGGVAHYNGSGWSPMATGTTSDLVSVCCISPSDVFAVGTDGVIIHYDGNSWTTMDSGTDIDLRDVWGSTPGDVFALGVYSYHSTWYPGYPATWVSVIFHYDGSAWSELTRVEEIVQNALWCSSSAGLLAVGDDGTISHYDGTSWSEMPSGTENSLHAIWGTSASDVFAVGDGGTVLHYNGSVWSVMANAASNTLQFVWGTSPSSVFAGGVASGPIHYDGSVWSSPRSGDPGLSGMCGASTALFGVGGSSLWQFDGGAWTEMLCDSHDDVSSLWGSSAADVFAVGGGWWNSSGQILHYDGRSWTRVWTTPSRNTGVWGSSPSDVFVVGGLWPTTGHIWHYDGTHWTAMSCPSAARTLLGVWGNSSSDVFAVGLSGTVLHYDGDSWSTMSSGTSWDLAGIWGSSASDVFAVGGGSGGADATHDTPWSEFVILHYDGSRWSTAYSGTSFELCGVWGSSATDVFAVGARGSAGGNILHYDGSAWSPMSTNTPFDFFGIWGTSSTDVFATGSPGAILHYDGKSWTWLISGVTQGLSAVWGSSPSNVFAVGMSGTILHYPETPSAPTLSSISPAEGRRGQTFDVLISGVFGHSPTLELGAGVAVNSFIVRTLNVLPGPTNEIVANITIATDAVPGTRDISIVTPGGTCTLPGGFQVIDAGSGDPNADSGTPGPDTGTSDRGRGIPPWVWIVAAVGGAAVIIAVPAAFFLARKSRHTSG